MSLAVFGQGTLLKVESGTSAGTFTTVPEAKKITAPDVKFDLIDVTSHDSSGGFKEYLPGLLDGNNVSSDLNFVPTNVVHTQLRTDMYSRTKRNFHVVFPGGGTGAQIAVAAYIQGLPMQADINAAISATLTAKVTGEPTWT